MIFNRTPSHQSSFTCHVRLRDLIDITRISKFFIIQLEISVTLTLFDNLHENPENVKIKCGKPLA